MSQVIKAIVDTYTHTTELFVTNNNLDRFAKADGWQVVDTLKFHANAYPVGGIFRDIKLADSTHDHTAQQHLVTSAQAVCIGKIRLALKALTG